MELKFLLSFGAPEVPMAVKVQESSAR